MLAKTGRNMEPVRQILLIPSAICHALRELEEDSECRIFTKMGKKFRPSLAKHPYAAPAAHSVNMIKLARMLFGACHCR